MLQGKSAPNLAIVVLFLDYPPMYVNTCVSVGKGEKSKKIDTKVFSHKLHICRFMDGHTFCRFVLPYLTAIPRTRRIPNASVKCAFRFPTCVVSSEILLEHIVLRPTTWHSELPATFPHSRGKNPATVYWEYRPLLEILLLMTISSS